MTPKKVTLWKRRAGRMVRASVDWVPRAGRVVWQSVEVWTARDPDNGTVTYLRTPKGEGRTYRR